MWNPHPRHIGSRTGSGLIALTLATAMALIPALSLAQDPDAAPITTGNPEADAVIAAIESVTADAIEAREQLRSDRLSPDVLLETIGSEPADILGWVVDETRWLPYQGALRGAHGVLMDRSGSSLDRALLLAELLSATGTDVRLARTTLDGETAADLATRELAVPWLSDTEPFMATSEEISAHRSDIESAAMELAAQADLLSGGPEASQVRDPGEVIADHWWVQALTDGEWVDLDPLFPADDTGRPAVTATVDPAAIPDEFRHAVTLRLVIERAENGAFVEEVPLEHTVLLGTDEPLKGLDLGFDISLRPEAVEGADEIIDPTVAAAAAAYWRPQLQDGSSRINGEWFSEAGLLESPRSLIQEEALSGAAGALGGLGSGEAEAPASSLSGAWIEYEATGPGLETRIERREILDLVGDRGAEVLPDDASFSSPDSAVRRGLAFMGDSSILLESAAAHPDAVLQATLDNWIEMRPALIALAFLEANVDDERIEPSLASVEFQPVGLMAMTGVRDRWAISPATYLGQPNVWSRHYFLDPASGESRMAVDIVLNDVDVLPESGVDPRLARLEQGMLDTLVEHELAGAEGGLNTWERYGRRDTEGAEWVVLLPDSAIAPEVTAALPQADLARMRDTLAGGGSVIVALEPRLQGTEPFVDWWRVASDGTTLGMGYQGWGQDLPEEAEVTQEISLKSLQPLLEKDRNRWYFRELREVVKEGRAMLARSRNVDPFAETGEFPAIIEFFLL